MIKTYEMVATVLIRVEGDGIKDARAEANAILADIARKLPTGATFRHADPAELKAS